MSNFINWELVAHPLNWVIVFLVLYFLSLATMYVAQNLSSAGINIL